jgi:hypothetical protein
MSDSSIVSEGVTGRAAIRWIEVAAAAGVAALFSVACCCPAARVGGCGMSPLGDWQEDYPGLAALLCGWLTVFLLPWFANPVLLVGCLALLRGQHLRAAALGGAALGLGLTARVVLVAPYELMPPSQGITWLYAGYYLWLGSMAVLVIGALAAAGDARCRQGRQECFTIGKDS